MAKTLWCEICWDERRQHVQAIEFYEERNLCTDCAFRLRAMDEEERKKIMAQIKKDEKKDSITTVSDMFRAIQEEIDSIKNGALTHDTARLVFRGRDLQIKTAELNLKFARVNRAMRRPDEELNVLTGKMVESTEDIM